MVTVVTEAIFSYCGAKVKIDTDRTSGPSAPGALPGRAGRPRHDGEYGSQMLSIGGVHHLTGGSKKEGRVTCDTIMDLCNRKPVEMTIDEGARWWSRPARAHRQWRAETRMRVGCGSATIGMFAKQWFDHVDEVVVVDDHITGVLSEHQAGKVLGARDTGIKIKGASRRRGAISRSPSRAPAGAAPT
jgi:6-hydroxynicotinate reductase